LLDGFAFLWYAFIGNGRQEGGRRRKPNPCAKRIWMEIAMKAARMDRVDFVVYFFKYGGYQ
jgi:hypothetical protein